MYYGLLALVLWWFRAWFYGAIRQLRSAAAAGFRGLPANLRAWSQQETPLHVIVLGGIVAAGIALRLIYLSEPIRYDEADTFLNYGRRTLAHALVLYPEPNNHILHSILVNICCKLLGTALWAVRLPAFLAGVLILPALYIATRRLYSGSVALLATALAATSAPLILYSGNARGYTMLVLFSLLLIWIAAELLEQASPVLWILFTACTVAGFFTVPIMAFTYGGTVLWILLSLWLRGGLPGIRPYLRGVIYSAVGVAFGVVAVYLPAAIVSGSDALLHNPWVRPMELHQFLAEAPSLPRRIGTFLHSGYPEVLYLVLMGCFVCSLLLHRRQPHVGTHLAWPMALASALIIAKQMTIPYSRVFIYLQPIWAIGIAAGAIGFGTLAGLRTPALRRVAAVLAVAIVAGSGAWLISSREIPLAAELGQASDIANVLKGELKPGDRLLATPQVGYYLVRQGIRFEDYVMPRDLPNRVYTLTQEDMSKFVGEGALHIERSSFEGMWRWAKLDPSLYGTRSNLFLDHGVALEKSVLRTLSEGAAAGK